MSNRQDGKVRMFDDRQGHGLITPDGGGDDLFVERKALENPGFGGLKQGQAVSFVAEEGPKGMHATLVRPE